MFWNQGWKSYIYVACIANPKFTWDAKLRDQVLFSEKFNKIKWGYTRNKNKCLSIGKKNNFPFINFPFEEILFLTL